MAVTSIFDNPKADALRNCADGSVSHANRDELTNSTAFLKHAGLFAKSAPHNRSNDTILDFRPKSK